MPIFLERFVLPSLAAFVVGVIIVNPLKFDWQQRVALLVVAFGLAYFSARTVYLGSHVAFAPAQSPSPTSPISIQSTGNATTSGPNSPAVSGSNNTVNSGNASQNDEHKSVEPAK
jgi:hypothetical protein